jgi:hypothetical protein
MLIHAYPKYLLFKEPYKSEEAKKMKMDERIVITSKIDDLLSAMYELGKVDGMREERLDAEEIVEAAYDRGADDGYNVAKREFHVPDL